MNLPCFFSHHWGRWQQYEETGMTRIVSFYTETRQRRVCQRCGRMQDEIVKAGPLIDAEQLARQRVGET